MKSHWLCLPLQIAILGLCSLTMLPGAESTAASASPFPSPSAPGPGAPGHHPSGTVARILDLPLPSPMLTGGTSSSSVAPAIPAGPPHGNGDEEQSAWIVPASTLPLHLARIARLSEDDRALLLHEISLEHQQIFETLVAELDHDPLEIQLYAAFLLGYYHLNQAAPHLAQHIALRDPDLARRPRDFWFWGTHPAMEALIRIGLPSVPYLIENLATSDDSNVRSLSWATLIAIEGPIFAPQVLKQAIAAQLLDSRRTHLEQALQILPKEP